MAQLSSSESNLLSCYDPELEGSATVAGRAVWVIDLGQASGCLPATVGGEPIGGVRVWVDKETYFVLKTELYEVPEQTVLFSAEVLEIEFNVPLDADLFTFTPPPGATIQEVNRPSAP
jgi:outer membrane lipoprotein-sorting protein